jgi:hypothetical protein
MMESTDNDCVAVPLRKWKLLGLGLLAALFVAGCVWIVGFPGSRRWPPAVADVAVGIVGIVFFGGGLVAIVWKLLDGKPGLVVDAEGFHDNSSAISAGWVAWHEVLAITTSYVAGEQLITIHVRDPEKYIRRGNAIQRWFKRMNWKYFGGPIHISTIGLRIDFDRLKALMEQHHADYWALGGERGVNRPVTDFRA